MATSKVWKMGQSVGTLAFIPMPGPDIDRTPVWNGAYHQSLANALTRDQLGPDKRSWTFDWKYLKASEFAQLKTFWDGTITWPYKLLDPRQDGGTFTVLPTAPPTTSIPRVNRYNVTLVLREA